MIDGLFPLAYSAALIMLAALLVVVLSSSGSVTESVPVPAESRHALTRLTADKPPVPTAHQSRRVHKQSRWLSTEKERPVGFVRWGAPTL